jgi:hypothetical protein
MNVKFTRGVEPIRKAILEFSAVNYVTRQQLLKDLLLRRAIEEHLNAREKQN